MADRLHPEDVEAIARRTADLVEARLRGQRPRGQRRHRSPELAAAVARERAEPDEIADRRARRALARLR